jgi:hypothetical protein
MRQSSGGKGKVVTRLVNRVVQEGQTSSAITCASAFLLIRSAGMGLSSGKLTRNVNQAWVMSAVWEDTVTQRRVSALKNQGQYKPVVQKMGRARKLR